MFRATLFDYNGVLADDEAVHLEAFRDALRPLGLEVSEADYFERYIGFDDVGAFRAILSDAGQDASDERIAKLVRDKEPHYMTRARAGLRGFAGAPELLAARAELGPVGVVSGALRPEIELGLEQFGLARSVAFIVSAEDTQHCKPDPEGYRLGLARLCELTGTALEAVLPRTIVVEDSVAGVQAAKAAGLGCIAVAHSASEAELLRAGADRVAPRLDALRPEDFMAVEGH